MAAVDQKTTYMILDYYSCPTFGEVTKAVLLDFNGLYCEYVCVCVCVWCVWCVCVCGVCVCLWVCVWCVFVCVCGLLATVK